MSDSQPAESAENNAEQHLSRSEEPGRKLRGCAEQRQSGEAGHEPHGRAPVSGYRLNSASLS